MDDDADALVHAALSVVAWHHELPPASLYSLLLAMNMSTSTSLVPTLALTDRFPSIAWADAVLDAVALGDREYLMTILSPPPLCPVPPPLPPTYYSAAKTLGTVVLGWKLGHRWGAEQIGNVAMTVGCDDWLELLSFAVSAQVLIPALSAPIAASQGGRGVEGLETLHRLGEAHGIGRETWDERVVHEAVVADRTDVVDWCMEHNLPLPDRVVAAAIVSGASFETIQSIVATGRVSLDASVYAAAASVGDLALIHAFRQRGIPWDSSCASSAARRGHLELLKWVRDEGGPWDSEVLGGAAMMGHVNVVRWALQNGAPHGDTMVRNAATMGHIAVLDAFAEHSPPIVPTPIDLDVVHYAGKYDVLRWALERDVPMMARTAKALVAYTEKK